MIKNVNFKMVKENFGDASFRRDYNLHFNYVAGAMCKGIASKQLVIRMGKAKLLSFLGTGGVKLTKIENDIQDIQQALKHDEPYGMNLLHNPYDPQLEHNNVALYFKYNITMIEAAAYMQATTALVRFRLRGISRDLNGEINTPHRIIAKVSNLAVAKIFMSPPPQEILNDLLTANLITAKEAELAQFIPIAQDICVEADSAGHTDGGVSFAIIPTFIKLRDSMMREYQYSKKIRIGAAGGIGVPEAALAGFMLGADFILTGSINQCTVEAEMSEEVKNLLQEVSIHDTDYAPAGDMFEYGAKIQVLKKGLLFPMRANKLYELYKAYKSIDELDEITKDQIQTKFFKRTFEEVWQETSHYLQENKADELIKAEKNPKYKMALIFKWYFIYSSRLARNGISQFKVDYQILCSPALGAFNAWVKGTPFEIWQNRHVDIIAHKIMDGAAQLLNNQTNAMQKYFTEDNCLSKGVAHG